METDYVELLKECDERLKNSIYSEEALTSFDYTFMLKQFAQFIARQSYVEQGEVTSVRCKDNTGTIVKFAFPKKTITEWITLFHKYCMSIEKNR